MTAVASTTAPSSSRDQRRPPRLVASPFDPTSTSGLAEGEATMSIERRDGSKRQAYGMGEEFGRPDNTKGGEHETDQPHRNDPGLSDRRQVHKGEAAELARRVSARWREHEQLRQQIGRQHAAHVRQDDRDLEGHGAREQYSRAQVDRHRQSGSDNELDEQHAIGRGPAHRCESRASGIDTVSGPATKTSWKFWRR